MSFTGQCELGDERTALLLPELNCNIAVLRAPQSGLATRSRFGSKFEQDRFLLNLHIHQTFEIQK
jgi:hypothetical protein